MRNRVATAVLLLALSTTVNAQGRTDITDTVTRITRRIVRVIKRLAPRPNGEELSLPKP